MNRREFMRSTGAVCGGLALTRSLPLFAEMPSTEGWRTFEVVTRVEVLKPSGVTHIWLPAALIRETPYQKTIANKFSAEGGTAKFTESKQDFLGIVTATYPEHAAP